MKLQILVTQYKEKKEIIKPLLDSIAMQQGIDFNEIGVIIVNDGYPKSKLTDRFLKSYPFNIEYYLEHHRGVSGARNSCLEHATADYVCFCDADDMFFSMVGLNVMFAEMDKGFNSLTTKFYEEIHSDGKMVFVEHKMDRTFVHGKFHNRKYLNDYKIKFDESLTVHEDSYFNCLATTLAEDPNTIKYSDVPIYLWRWRDDSVCRHDKLYMQKTYNKYLDSMTSLIDTLVDMDRGGNADQIVVQTVFDTYYLMNTTSWLTQDNQEYRVSTEKRFKEFYEKYEKNFYSMPEHYRVAISNSVRTNKLNSGLQMEKLTFDQWIHYIIGLN